ncbi:MAG: methyltransferase domain-containing protein [Anaerolineales bacterium]|nr:methyltransferase domain-containing protein [Anaerolineales bacterium]
MILPARRPTLARWRRLAGAPFSLLRSLEYERLAGFPLHGLVLDVGGGTRNSYLHLLRLDGQLETVNIDPAMQPTYLADLNQPLPIPSNRYDAVISLNTLEHIEQDRVALAEIGRVLKPGASAHLIVPFLYRVHGSPNDYHRHTASAWIAMLSAAGFARETIRIEPLAFGRLSAGFALMEFFFPGPLRWLLKHAVLLLIVLRDAVRASPAEAEMDMPLGYFITASKKAEGAA